jgi:NMT1/THI5 like
VWFNRPHSRGDFDFGLLFAPEVVMALEAGLPITALAGVHNGCFELFGNERIRGIADLKDRTVGAQSASTATQLVTIMTSYIGLDPAKDPSLGHRSYGYTARAFYCRANRCFSCCSARVTRTARPEHRPRDPKQLGRPAVVAIFLLHVDGQRGIRPQASWRDKALDTSGSQGQ